MYDAISYIICDAMEHNKLPVHCKIFFRDFQSSFCHRSN